MDLLKNPDFAAYVKHALERYHVPGIAIAMVQGNRIESAGFGKASLDPPADCNPDTLFDIASTSKSLTAASVALLIDDNDKYPQVQYESRMSDLLPGDFVMPGNDHNDVTVEDVLSHRTGMAPNDYSLLGPNAAQPDDARSVTRNLRNLITVAPNRSEYLYCNLMFTAASYLVECKSGLKFSEFIQTRFFKPLGMQSTNLQPQGAREKGLAHRLATGYYWDKEAGEYVCMPCHDSPEAQGAGRIISSVNDYIKWVRALMNKQAPITESIYQGLVKKRISQSPPLNDSEDSEGSEGGHDAFPTFAAAGVEIHQYCGHTMITHDGLDLGYGSTLFFLPELKFGAVVFGNSNNASNVARIIKFKLTDWVTGKRSKELLGVITSLDSGSESEDEDSDEEEDEDGFTELENEMIGELCAGGGKRTEQTMPLGAYVGTYWNDGYKGIKVEEKNGGLFVNGRDRSMGFTLTFKHICEQKGYIAYLSEMTEHEKSPIKAEFKLEGERAVELGLSFEDSWDGYIWFKRI
ncbi:hypothetical protein MferCBS31731_003702 [Microsporum ferrugineum]